MRIRLHFYIWKPFKNLSDQKKNLKKIEIALNFISEILSKINQRKKQWTLKLGPKNTLVSSPIWMI